MSTIRAILFDNDGTLVDTHDIILESLRYATKDVLGYVPPDDVLMAKVGQPLVVQMKDFSDNPDVQKMLVDSYHKSNDAKLDSSVKLFSGEMKGLARLHDAGFSMGVVTSKISNRAWRGLEVLGIAKYFDCLVGADSCEHYKPHPEPVLLGAQHLGIRPEECVYVGDSPFDMQAGRKAGCTTAAVLWGMFDEATLREQQPDYVCKTFEDLAETLLKLA